MCSSHATEFISVVHALLRYISMLWRIALLSMIRVVQKRVNPRRKVGGREDQNLGAANFDWQPMWRAASPVLYGWMSIASVWLVLRSVWFRWRLRTARRVHGGRVLELLRELNGPVRVRLLIVPGFAEPAAFGLFRPTIALPPSCESLPRDELRAVLAHELGHIMRGDLRWLLIGRVLTTVFAFQPLNRIARREWTAAAECLCDSVGRGSWGRAIDVGSVLDRFG